MVDLVHRAEGPGRSGSSFDQSVPGICFLSLISGTLSSLPPGRSDGQPACRLYRICASRTQTQTHLNNRDDQQVHGAHGRDWSRRTTSAAIASAHVDGAFGGCTYLTGSKVTVFSKSHGYLRRPLISPRPLRRLRVPDSPVCRRAPRLRNQKSVRPVCGGGGGGGSRPSLSNNLSSNRLRLTHS